MRILAALCGLALVASTAAAKGDKKPKPDDDSADDSSDDESSDDEGDAPKPKAKTKVTDEGDEGGKPVEEPKKQDLTGHDLGTKKKATEFERDRFFVDKADSGGTENGTLVQGSMTATTFLYGEAGGN